MIFLFLALKKMYFKELFVCYDNVLAFYCFFKIHQKNLVKNIQQRIELMFDLDEFSWTGD